MKKLVIFLILGIILIFIFYLSFTSILFSPKINSELDWGGKFYNALTEEVYPSQSIFKPDIFNIKRINSQEEPFLSPDSPNLTDDPNLILPPLRPEGWFDIDFFNYNYVSQINLDPLGKFYMKIVQPNSNGKDGKIILLNQNLPYEVYKVINIPAQLPGSIIAVWYLSPNLFRTDTDQKLEYLLTDGLSYVSIYNEDGNVLLRWERTAVVGWGAYIDYGPVIKTNYDKYKLILYRIDEERAYVVPLPGNISEIISVW